MEAMKESEELFIYAEIIHSIENTIGGIQNRESGGIMGIRDGAVTKFEFDMGSYSDSDIYVPDISHLNRVLSEWADKEVVFCGLIHSHKRNPKLSVEDMTYAREIIKINNMQYIYMFLYILVKHEIKAYIVKADEVRTVRLQKIYAE